MKRVNFYLAIALVSGSIFLAQCKKDDAQSPSSSGIKSTDVTAVQESESQEAVIDQVDQNTDIAVDNLESTGYETSSLKSASNEVVVTVDKGDTIRFPKIIKLEYIDCADTIAGEIVTLNGTITIVVDTVPVNQKMYWRKHLSRTITFTDYSVKTDSSTFVLNGTRTMSRQSVTSTLSSDSLSKRTVVKDTIHSDFNLSLSYFNAAGDSVNKTITRNAQKTRLAYLHYTRSNIRKNNWHHVVKSDTVIVSGVISGINASGESYSRTFTSPLKFTHSLIWPYNEIISSGTIQIKIGSEDPFTINYASNTLGTKTVVTLTRNGETKTIERRVGRRFKR